MGAKDSKPSFITYEEAVKRVSDGELKRLKDAFKRSSTLSGYMTKPVFIREVLGDGVPPRLAEQMYVAFGGTAKGLAMKDLLCGLVLLTRGRQEEKVKFLFGLYANEALTHVQQEEMDRLVLATEGQVPQALSYLFRDTDRATYEHFRDWVLSHPDTTSVTQWLLREPCSVTLSNNLETPTFYQTLAGVTHLEETDITELEKRYWTLKAQSKTGRFDVETFRPIVCPPIPEELCEGVFHAFDENRDNHIDFKEMACGISACCRGPMTERQKFCFKIFDADHDGLLNEKELKAMVTAMLTVRSNTKSPDEQAFGLLQDEDRLPEVDPEQLAADILRDHDSDMDGLISQEDFLVWTVSHPLPDIFLQLLFQILFWLCGSCRTCCGFLEQVCHVVLGLKPQTKEDEACVISGWLEREERQGLVTGTTWYLVSMTWWRQWLEYVNLKPIQVDLAEEMVPMDNGTPVTTSRTDVVRKPQTPVSRAGSLCRNLGRKSSIGFEESGGVVGTSFSMAGDTTPGSATASPTKYSSLPRAGVSTSPQSLTASPQNSPHRTSLSVNSDVNSSPSHSRNGSPSPCPSPKLGKRNTMAGLAQRPGAIDNTPLIYPNTQKIMMLTNEGGRLKRDRMLARGRDFELLPEPVWKALSGWYGGSPALPRTVITPSHGGGTPELELYPITVRLLRHQAQPQRPNQVSSFSGMIGGMGGMAVSTAGLTQGQLPTPRRYLAYQGAFSRKHSLRQVYEFLTTRLRIPRDDLRLWKFKDEHNMYLLEEEHLTMEQLAIEENQQILIEVRNKDLTWPEEMSQLAKTKASIDKKQQVPTERGATGLNNLGNTCFMNSALQCVSNTRILTLYFTGGMHLYEINRNNPLGMKGHVAQRYGDLVKDLWSGTAKSIAPLKLRWTIGKYAPRFNGFQQHDSQELLAFLLDGLHEDLNRVHDKPYVELKDSDGRSDEIVAKEAWDNHMLRNRSIVVDLFHGQLKSCVRCLECGHTSVRFDPFTYLSLPLPMDSCIHIEVIVVRLDGSVPVKYGLRLNMDEKYKTLKSQLSELCNLHIDQLLVAEIAGALVKSLPQDSAKIKTSLGGSLYAYELPPMPEIATMTALEERSLTQSPKVHGGLSQIQRRHQQTYSKHTSSPGSRDQVSSVNHSNGNHDPVINSTSSGQSSPNLQRIAPRTVGALSSGPMTNGLANGKPSGPGHPVLPGAGECHQRNASSASTSSSSTSGGNNTNNGNNLDYFHGFVVAVHRKMIRMDVYFLSSQKSRPSVFGTPLILPSDQKTTNQDIYSQVWAQVSRLVSPLPPSEAGTPNHAQDCDDSMGYEYPFTLKAVQKDGFTCAWCPWFRFCRGCKVDCNSDLFNFGSSYIAVDWEPTALHLRYQTSQERMYAEHLSVSESRRLQTEPIDLDTCLKAFTKEEELGEDELYYCSKCKQHRLAAKKLEIWRLPPILIIHLKRFQFMNGRWVKSQKIVKFPVSGFDPANYLVPRQPVSRRGGPEKLVTTNGATNHNTNGGEDRAGDTPPTAHSEKRDSGTVQQEAKTATVDTKTLQEGDNIRIGPEGGGDGSQPREMSDIVITEKSGKDTSAPPGGDSDPMSKSIASLCSLSNEDYTNVRYDLYALSCHTGILGGGHYVSYSKNPNDKWYCYNDSSCKEITNIDTDSAYILFYERQNLDYSKFMPDICGKEPDTMEIDDEFESDFKKMCVLQ